MILLDLSQISLSGTFSFSEDLKQNSSDKEKGKNILRHIILSQIKTYKKKFSSEFGDIVISCDGHHYWRKEIFPQYKIQRKKLRSESDLDWKLIFDCISEIISDLKENFPYKVIFVDNAESDDVIAVLTKKMSEKGEKILIVSSDMDFAQLHKYGHVRQISPQTKKYVVVENPEEYLFEKIIRGDRGDGIPNILSPDNTFSDGIKQSAITKKKLEGFKNVSPKESTDETIRERFGRNERLIDFNFIPKEIEEKILEEFDKPIKGSKGKIFKYLIEKKCSVLLNDIDSF